MFRRMKCTLAPLLLAVLMAASAVAPVRAAEPLHWPYFPYPVLFIVEDDTLDGFGFAIRDMLSVHFPEYDHIPQFAPPRRILADAAQGERLVVTGLLKTDFRQEFLAYTTVPCGLALPVGIAVRKEDADKLAPDGEFPVGKNLASHKLKWGFQDGVNHGELEAVLRPNKDDPGVLRQSGKTPIVKMIMMLLSKRLDWFPCNPMTVDYYAKKHGLEAYLAVLPTSEQAKEPSLLYLACPKTEWGKAMIVRLDVALAREVLNGTLYDILEKYTPLNLHASFRKSYERYVLPPARRLLGQTMRD